MYGLLQLGTFVANVADFGGGLWTNTEGGGFGWFLVRMGLFWRESVYMCAQLLS